MIENLKTPHDNVSNIDKRLEMLQNQMSYLTQNFNIDNDELQELEQELEAPKIQQIKPEKPPSYQSSIKGSTIKSKIGNTPNQKSQTLASQLKPKTGQNQSGVKPFNVNQTTPRPLNTPHTQARQKSPITRPDRSVTPKNVKKQPQHIQNSATSKQSQTTYNRYQHLVNTNEVEIPQKIQQKTSPQISQKWTQIFGIKPDLQTLFDKNTFNPVWIDKKDFTTKVERGTDYGNFETYMESYALIFDQQCQ